MARSGGSRTVTLGRIIKYGFVNFWRSLTLAIAAVAVMTITLTIVLFSFLANEAVSHTITQLTDRIDISVYLIDDITEQQRSELINRLYTVENVRSIDYISKDQALQSYKDANSDNPDLLLAISQTDNPLPASLRIKPHDPNRIDEIRTVLEEEDVQALQSEETSYSGARKDAIDAISSGARFYQQAGLIGVAVFTIVSVLIIFNTIQMAIFNRRDELKIMRLLGAKTSFIRGPFVVEAILYGVISGGLSLIIYSTLFGVATSSPAALTTSFVDVSYVNTFFNENFLYILTAQLGLGILIGAASSIIATRRYLTFKTSK